MRNCALRRTGSGAANPLAAGSVVVATMAAAIGRTGTATEESAPLRRDGAVVRVASRSRPGFEPLIVHVPAQHGIDARIPAILQAGFATQHTPATGSAAMNITRAIAVATRFMIDVANGCTIFLSSCGSIGISITIEQCGRTHYRCDITHIPLRSHLLGGSQLVAASLAPQIKQSACNARCGMIACRDDGDVREAERQNLELHACSIVEQASFIDDSLLVHLHRETGTGALVPAADPLRSRNLETLSSATGDRGCGDVLRPIHPQDPRARSPMRRAAAASGYSPAPASQSRGPSRP